MVGVTAVRWDKGWDLILDEDNATSVTRLRDATRQVRDYLDTIEPEVCHDDVDIEIKVDLGQLEGEIVQARQATIEAARQQRLAAVRLRKVARKLKDKNIPAEDAASLLEVSRARFYQLIHPAGQEQSTVS